MDQQQNDHCLIVFGEETWGIRGIYRYAEHDVVQVWRPLGGERWMFGEIDMPLGWGKRYAKRAVEYLKAADPLESWLERRR